jgi:hypothetical protein
MKRGGCAGVGGMETLKSVWDGRRSLTDDLDRDYAAMRGDGWDLIWEPQSPLTTPWDDLIRRFAWPDPNMTLTPKQALIRRNRDVEAEVQNMRNEVALSEYQTRETYERARKKARHRSRRGLR